MTSLLLLIGLSLLSCKHDGDSGAPGGDSGGGDSGPVETGIDWLVVGGGTSRDAFYDLGLRSDGDLVALARNSAAGRWWRDRDDEFEVISAGQGSSLVVWAATADGAVQRTVLVDSPTMAVPESLAVGPDDQVAVLVQALGEVSVDGMPVTGADFGGHVVLQLSAEGALDWALPVTHDGTETVGFWGEVEYDVDGSLLVGLTTAGDVYADDADPYLQALGPGGLDNTSLRIGADGTPLWLRLWGDAGEQFWMSLAPVPDGYVAAGSGAQGMVLGTSPAQEIGTTEGGADAWVGRFDDAGGVVWLTTFGSTAEDSVMELLVADDGGVWVCGQFAYGGSGPLVADGVELLQPDSADGSDAFVVRLDPASGAVTAAAGLVTDTNDVPDLLVPYQDGAVFFGGEGFGAGDTVSGAWSDGTALVSSADELGFLAVVAADGSLSSHHVADDQGLLGAAALPDGDVLIGGWYVDGARFGAGPDALAPTSAGAADAFLSRGVLAP